MEAFDTLTFYWTSYTLVIVRSKITVGKFFSPLHVLQFKSFNSGLKYAKELKGPIPSVKT